MKGSGWFLLVFLSFIGLIALVFMTFQVPMGYIYQTTNSITPAINDSSIQANVTTTTQNIWNFWLMMPFAFLVMAIIWAFARALKKDPDNIQYYPA